MCLLWRSHAMTDLDTLRPEVREAVFEIDCYPFDCKHNVRHWKNVRAELLRLATIEADALIALDCEHDWQVEHKRAEKAEAELLRLTDENVRLNKIESLATEQRLQMEDVELYLMDVSQPDDEDAPWCDRMKYAIELLVQDCNYAVGQKNKAEAELAALKARIAEAPVVACPKTLVHAGNTMQTEFLEYTHERMPGGCNSWAGKRVRLVVDEPAER